MTGIGREPDKLIDSLGKYGMFSHYHILVQDRCAFIKNFRLLRDSGESIFKTGAWIVCQKVMQ